jgi:2-polyprenyl-6-hydroxyphenyl methylase/3-demethylubiquinone-9 3-methyltransferase
MKDFSENRSIDLALDIFQQRIVDAKEIWHKFSADFILRNCPVCNYDDSDELEKFIDLYPISKCKRCQTVYSKLTPNFNAIEYYYNHCKCNSMLHTLFKQRSESKNDFVNDYRINHLLSLLNQIKSDKEINILEIGCGTGAFLKKLKKSVDDQHNCTSSNLTYNFYGIDIDQNAIDLCDDKSIKLFNKNAEDFTFDDCKFDIIIHFELIEHLINPTKFIKNIHLNLQINGHVVFTTPNSLGLETKAIGYNKTRLLAHSIFPPMHLNAFNTRNIYFFLLHNGFNITSITTPGCLDVSILLHTLDDVDPNLKEIIVGLSKESYHALQYITTYLDGSSHMFCIAQKLSSDIV